MELNLGSPSHAVVLKYKYVASWRYRTAFPEITKPYSREREREREPLCRQNWSKLTDVQRTTIILYYIEAPWSTRDWKPLSVGCVAHLPALWLLAGSQHKLIVTWGRWWLNSPSNRPRALDRDTACTSPGHASSTREKASWLHVARKSHWLCRSTGQHWQHFNYIQLSILYHSTQLDLPRLIQVRQGLAVVKRMILFGD